MSVFYVGPIGPGRKLTGGMYFPFDPLESYLAMGGDEESYRKAFAAGYRWEKGTWAYKGAPECFPDGSKVEGKSYAGIPEIWKAMASCNERLNPEGEQKECCCCKKCEGCGCDSENTYTPDGAQGSIASNRGIEPGTGMSGQGSGGSSSVAMVPLGPWNIEKAEGGSPSQGDTVAQDGGRRKDGSCCCTPCDPTDMQYQRGNIITSDPVTSYVRTGGLAIETGYGQMLTRSGLQEGVTYSGPSQPMSRPQSYYPMTQAQPGGVPSSAEMRRPRTVAVPGYQGPVSRLKSAPTSTASGEPCGCGCGCKDGEGKSAPADLMTRSLPVADVIGRVPDPAPAAPRVVTPAFLSGRPGIALAGAADAAAFTSLSSSLLADVLKVASPAASLALASPPPRRAPAAPDLASSFTLAIASAARRSAPATASMTMTALRESALSRSRIISG